MAEHAVGVEVVTPEQELFAGAATAVVLATSEGDLTVMAGHAETIGDVMPGIVKIEREDGDDVNVIVHGGFVQIHTAAGAAGALVDGAGEAERTTRVTLLVGIAELTTELDVARAQEAKAAAETRVSELKNQANRSSDDSSADATADLALAEADLARAELRLSVPASQI